MLIKTVNTQGLPKGIPGEIFEAVWKNPHWNLQSQEELQEIFFEICEGIPYKNFRSYYSSYYPEQLQDETLQEFLEEYRKESLLKSL